MYRACLVSSSCPYAMHSMPTVGLPLILHGGSLSGERIQKVRSELAVLLLVEDMHIFHERE